MTNITLQKQHHTLWHFILGLAPSVVITGVILWGSSIPAVAGARFGALILAISLGMVLGNTIYPYIWKSCGGGVLFARQYLLRLGIILYGFRLTFLQVADAGINGIVVDVLTLPSTFLLTCSLGQKVFSLGKYTSWLTGAGNGICSAAAVLATEPVVKAEASEVAVAVAAVAIFGIVTTFLYPAIYPLMSQWFSPETFGIYIGSIVHEVAQMMAAGHVVSPDAENAAVVSKMLRMIMLAPFLTLLTVRVKQLSRANSSEKSKITIPWFAVLFIVVAIFNSFHLLPQSVVDMLVALDTFLLTMAMATLGLTTHVSALKKAGVKPLLTALILFTRLIVDGGAINYMIRSVIA